MDPTISLYIYVKSKRHVKDNIGPLRDSNGRTSSEKKNFTAETLNKFFSQMFTNENTSFVHEALTAESVYKHLLKRKANKAPGPDGFGSNILKDLCDVIFIPLSMLFNQS